MSSYQDVRKYEVRKQILYLDGCKTSPTGHIFVNILESIVGIHLPVIENIKNFSIEKVLLQKKLNLLKLAPFSRYPSLFYLMCQTNLKESCIMKYMSDKLSKHLKKN